MSSLNAVPKQVWCTLVAWFALACSRDAPNDRIPDAAASPPMAAASGFPPLPPDRETILPPASPGPAFPASAPSAPPVAARPGVEAAKRAVSAAEACQDCHPDETEGYLATGMGRSLYTPQSRPAIEDFSKATVRNGRLEYRAYIDAEGRWWQEETMPGTQHRRRVEATHVIGSGNHTRSYLGEVEGEIVELPLTWYVRRAIWDMSPGYAGAGNQRFTRPVKADCLFCHNDLTPTRPDTRAGYATPLAQGITCVRCHGDATTHVAQRTAGQGPAPGQPDPSILNPKRLSPTRQLQICQQCHLQGETRILLEGQRWDVYDPRTPLPDYVSTFVYIDDQGHDFSIASHGHRLSLSACAKAPSTLPCTTCHDPHHQDKGKAAREACLGCHQVADCKEEHGAAQDRPCASCHMRQGDTSDIPHVTFTDHFIRKRPDQAPGKPAVQVDLIDALASERDPARDTPAQALLRLGLAHAQLWRFEGQERHRPEARARLTTALQAVPHSTEGWFWLARIATADGDLVAAQNAWARLEALDPKASLYRTEQAEVLEMMGDLAGAERTLRAAIELNPRARVATANLGNILQKQGRLAEAEVVYARADALGPDEALTAINRAFNFMQLGQPAEATRWFQAAIQRDGHNPRGHFGLGLLASEQGRWVDARGHFDQAIDLAPDFADAWWLRGRAALEAGDLEAARRDLDQLLTLVPGHVGGYLDRAQVEERAGNAEARQAILMRGLQQAPGHPALREALNSRPR